MIDSHAHIGTFKNWNCSIEHLYDQMKVYGVGHAIVSNLAGNEFDYEHNRLNEYSANDINTVTLKAIKQYGDTFKMLAWIRPFSDSNVHELDEFIRIHKEYVVGLKVHPYTSKVKLFDERYQNYLNLCKKYNIPFCIHTEEDSYSNIKYVKILAENNPDIKFIAVHMGLKTDHRRAIEYISKNENLYGDTTLVSSEDVLKAINICGEDSILFGSDATVLGPDSYRRYLEMRTQIEENFGEQTATKIFSTNCMKIFGLEETWTAQ